MKKFSLFLATFAALIFSCPAFAQSVPLQGGPWTAGHQPMYSLSGGSQPVVQDGGGASGGAAGANPSELGLTIRGTGTAPYANQGNGPLNTNLCDYDAPTNNSSGYHYLCLSPNAQGGGILAYGAGGGASQLPLYFNINGTNYEFPAALSGVAGPSTSVIDDLACWNNTTGTLLKDCAASILRGPDASTVNDIATFNNTSGSLIQDSGISLGSQSQNYFLATPSAASGAPTFRPIVGADLPTPQVSALGGVFQSAAGANQIVTGLNSTGALVYSSLPTPTSSLLGGAKSSSAPSNEFATGLDTSGNLSYAQPSASGTTFIQGGTGAVSQSMQDKGRQLVWIKDYGAVCDGSTDDTTAIQDAWNYAASVGKSVYLGGVGTNCLISSISAPTPSSGALGNRSGLVGDGMGVTRLTTTNTSGCAIKIAATYGTNSDYNADFRDFSLIGQSATEGSGICLTQITRINFARTLISQFSNDLLATDSINVECDYCRFLDATVGVNASYSSYSHPNAWTFISPSVGGITTYGMIFQNPANLNIVGGDWENNGWGTSTAAALYIQGNPVEGTQGLSMRGGYFSFNNGLADVFIDQNSGTTGGTHDIEGVEFQRVDGTDYTLHNVELNNNGTGTTSVRVAGSGFAGFNSYVPDSGRAYITAATVASSNYVFSTGGNYYQSSTETPSGAYFNETAWATWTPTLGCGSGSLTTASATGRYKRLSQKTVAMQEVATITANGTCATQLRTSVPATPASQSVGSWKDVVNSPGGQCQLDASGTQALCTTGSGAYPLSGSSGTLWISQVYETQ